MLETMGAKTNPENYVNGQDPNKPWWAHWLEGRPTDLTEELAKKILKTLETSLYLETAAQIHSVDDDLLCLWLEKGRQGVHPYKGFFCKVNDVMSANEERLVKGVMDRGRGWTAYCWLLERRYGERWSDWRKEIKELERRLAQLEGNPIPAVDLQGSDVPREIGYGPKDGGYGRQMAGQDAAMQREAEREAAVDPVIALPVQGQPTTDPELSPG